MGVRVTAVPATSDSPPRAREPRPEERRPTFHPETGWLDANSTGDRSGLGYGYQGIHPITTYGNLQDWLERNRGIMSQEPERENSRLEKPVLDLTLDNAIVKKAPNPNLQA